MKKIKLLSAILPLSVIASIATTVGCSCTPTVKTLTVKGENSLLIGETCTYSAVDDDSKTVDCSWFSSDQDVASFNGEVLTAIKTGTTTITAKSKANNEIKGELKVTITEGDLDVSDDDVFKYAYGYMQSTQQTKGLSTFYGFKLGEGQSVENISAKIVNLKSSALMSAKAEVEDAGDNYFNVNVTFDSVSMPLVTQQVSFGIKIQTTDGQAKIFTGFATPQFMVGIKVNNYGYKSDVLYSTLTKQDYCEFKPNWSFSAYVGDTLTTDFSKFKVEFLDDEGKTDNTITAQIVNSSINTEWFNLKIKITDLASKSGKLTRTMKFTNSDYPLWSQQQTAAFVKSDTPLVFKATSDTTAELTRCLCSDDEITIDPTVTIGEKTYTVTSIAEEAFKESFASTINLPDTLTSIGKHAFTDSEYLKSIKIGKNVASIGAVPCRGCVSLESITVDSENTTYFCKGQNYIGTNIDSVPTIIQGCKNSTIDSSIKVLDTGSFFEMGLTGDWEIPEGVEKIKSSVFNSNTGLNSMKLSSTVKSIGNFCFRSCHMNAITLNEGLESIGECCFQWNTFTTITIPKTVTSIGSNFLGQCPMLGEIIVADGNTVYSSKSDKDVQCNYIRIIETNELISGCRNTTISEGIVRIGDFAFNDHEFLTNITIPNTVTSIGISAFRWTGLMSIEIPSSVKVIDETAFDGCTLLTSVTLNEGLEEINRHAFVECTNLETITIPASVLKIHRKPFEGCDKLTSGIFKYQSWTDMYYSSKIIDVSTPELGAQALKTTTGMKANID